jgi:TRAP-type C4-dicarboxylate transport system substrate-binding protein
VTEPFHTESVWAAEEIGKRTDGRYQVTVFPASQLGKEADINQGLKLGTVDIIISEPDPKRVAMSENRVVSGLF